MDDGEQPGGTERNGSSSGSHRPSRSTDPLHGVTLERVVRHLHAEYGWEGLAARVPVRCFQRDPSVTSSLKFLRKTPWAREQVDGEYVKLTRREDANPLIGALKRAQYGDLPALLTPGALSQTRVHAALGWALRHLGEEGLSHQQALLNAVEDVNFWPDGAPLPLLNQAIEVGAPAALIRALLQAGARPDDARYWLPLLHATDVEGRALTSGRRAPRTDTFDLLLAHGADATQADGRGVTALDIARAYRLNIVINRLEHAGR